MPIWAITMRDFADHDGPIRAITMGRFPHLLGNTEGIDRDVAVWVITNAQSRVQLGSVTIPFPCVVGEMDPERYKSVFSHFLLPLTDLFNKAPAESVVGIEFDFAAT